MRLPRTIAVPRPVTVVLTALALVVSLLTTTAPATAAEEDPPDPAVGFIASTTTVETVMINENDDIVLAGNLRSDQIASQCVPRGERWSYCVGGLDNTITIQGVRGITSGTAPELKWISNEALEFLQITYDVPLDDRLRAYAAPMVHAYTVQRILDIVDKAAYNQPLTPEEQGTLDWLETQLLASDLAIAQAAFDEWERWEAQKCAYVPPSAPAWVTEPLLRPGAINHYCSMPARFAVFSLPPMPNADEFRVWGTYAAADQAGLTELADPVAQELAARAIAGYVGLAGIAVSAAAAGATFAVVSGSTALATSIASMLGSVSLWAGFSATYSPAAAAAAAATMGTISATAFVAFVVLAVISIGVSAWQLHENLQVGPRLTESLAIAKAASDPLGLVPLRAQNEGKELREGMTPETMPPYYSNGLWERLISLVVINVGVGESNRTGTWPGSAHTDLDYRFNLGEGNLVDEVSVPKPDGTRSTVWFSKDWMVERTADGTEHAILQLQYVDHQGRTVYASRSGDAFLVTATENDLGEDGVNARTGPISFLSESGALVLATVGERARQVLGGPRPTAAGALFPGRVVNLRPNPVAADGSFALETFVDGYTFEWRLQARTLNGGWEDLPFEDRPQGTNPTYGARFVPSQAGQYAATVTMTSVSEPELPAQTGRVEFTVASPELTLPIVQVHDTGAAQVRVQTQAQLSSPLPGEIVVEAQWPGDLGSEEPGPVTSVTVACHPVDAATCMTTDFDADLTHTLAPTARLRDGVVVTVRDAHGTAVEERRLEFDTVARPSFATPPPPPLIEQFGTVYFDPYQSTLTVPVETTGSNDYAVATVIPGGGTTEAMTMIDPRTNDSSGGTLDLFPGTDMEGRYYANVARQGEDWVLRVNAQTRIEDIGSYTVPLTIRQSDNKRATLFLTINPVLAPGDRFRGTVTHEIDPLDFSVTELPEIIPIVSGGVAAWGAYEGQVCVGLNSEELCGPAGEIVGQPFPFEKLQPWGVDRGVNRARAWLPDGDEHAWDVPISVTFAMLTGPPRISELAWDGATLTATITPGRTSEIPGEGDPVPLAAVSCELDGVPADTCFASTSGGSWDPGELADGPHTVLVRVTDTVGNYTTSTLDFTVQAADTTPPVIEAQVTGITGTGDWFVGDVSVAWVVTDGESEVTSTTGCEPTVVDTDTTGQTLTCEATSTGGAHSESVTVHRDATPPQVSVTGVTDGAVYQLGAVPDPTCETVDATSGVSVPADVTVVGGEPDGVGRFTATCSGAVDTAGNAAAMVSTDFTVRAVIRVSGADRYATAAAVSQAFAPGVDTVFVATGQVFPDALAAAALAGSLGGPVLLTMQGTLPPVTAAELARLQPSNIVVVGGPGAVSTAVEQEIGQAAPAATVTRLAGSDRYETAAQLVATVVASDVVYVASGAGFPDALAGSARAGMLDAPMLLVGPGHLPEAAAQQLQRLAPARIVLLGGTAAVSPEVEAELAAYGLVQRVSGADRYGTAAAVAQEWSTSTDVFVATGLTFPDALAGSALAGHTGSPVLLVETGTVPPSTLGAIERLEPLRIYVLGGPGSVADTVLDELAAVR